MARFVMQLCKKIVTLLMVAAIGSYSITAEDFPPKRGQTETVEFPKLGTVRVEGVVRTRRLPEVRFTDASSNRVLRAAELGANFLTARFIDPSDPQADPYPIVRLKVMQFPGLGSPIVFAGVMEGGGSDFAYGGQLFAEVRGVLSSISPQLPMVNAEGGYAIGEFEKGKGVELAAWNMIWREGEGHPGPHDHWVRIYRFNPASGKFEFVRKYVVPKGQRDVNFPNILHQIPDFGC